LPAVLTAILKDALRGLRVPDVSHLPALYEVLRVGANLCVDHGVTGISSSPVSSKLTPPQTRTENTSSTRDFSAHSSPYSSATLTSSPLKKPLISYHYPWHI